MQDIVYAMTLGAEFLLLYALSLSLLIPKFGMWPPRNWWHYYYHLILKVIAGAGFITLCYIGFDTFIIEHWIRYSIGTVFVTLGIILIFLSYRSLGFRKMTGIKGSLVTTGAYCFSRNPLYVGAIFFIIGAVIDTNSVYALITGFFGAAWFIFAPMAEERLLKRQTGKPYLDYMKKVKRFI